VSFRGKTHTLQVPEDERTVDDLHARLEELTGVAPAQQKLLVKGKRIPTVQDSDGDGSVDSPTLLDVGIKSGTKITLLGATRDELGGMQKEEDEQRRRERIMRNRAAKGAGAKIRSTGPSSSSSSNYVFHRLEPLAHLPEPATALATLKKLAADPAIRHVMNMHKFSVGLLTELAPHEAPNLLGLNVNAGQAIKLRLRTNQYDGFRSYNELRRVLCHELTHNVWGDHDDNFKELNSRLNREVTEFEQSSHVLGDSGGYHPSSELEAEARAFVLGGPGVAPSRDESVDERRRRVLEATMTRLRKEEEELERSCGTAPPGSSST